MAPLNNNHGSRTGVAVEMQGKRPSGLRSVILVWAIGLALGIAAGALTAMLLLPSEKGPAAGQTLADQIGRMRG